MWSIEEQELGPKASTGYDVLPHDFTMAVSNIMKSTNFQVSQISPFAICVLKLYNFHKFLKIAVTFLNHCKIRIYKVARCKTQNAICDFADKFPEGIRHKPGKKCVGWNLIVLELALPGTSKLFGLAVKY